MGQATATTADLAEAIQHTLKQSGEPLTPAKIRDQLAGDLRRPPIESIVEVLQRQSAAGVLFVFPKYRSQHDRYWDRPMRDHVEQMLLGTLADEPLPRAELRRRLPAYARILADTVLTELLAQGRVHLHPALDRRGPRYATRAAEPRDFLRPRVDELFLEVQRFGFTRAVLRSALLDMLHEEEWQPEASRPAAPDWEHATAAAVPQRGTPNLEVTT